MTNTSDIPDALIMGGGVIGLSLAWELSKRNLRITVVESGELGRGASWAGAGILPPTATENTTDPYEQLRAFSHQLHREWAEQLLFATGIDTGFKRCGGIYLARTAAEAATLAANRFWWEEHSIAYEKLTPNQISELEPALRPLANSSLLAAWLLPDECQLRNPRHLKALAAACRKSGVVFKTHCPLADFVTQDGVISHARSAAGELLPAKQFCVCSGAWARHILNQLGFANGIMPVRGQMVLYAGDGHSHDQTHNNLPPLTRVINEGHRYLVPRRDGRLLAGSIEEEVGYTCETTEAGIAAISGWAEEILPSLAHVPKEKTWAGLRPGSFDGYPYLGQVPGFNNLFLAAGHFRSGIHLSCGTAVVIANLMQGHPNSIDLLPFRIGRG